MQSGAQNVIGPAEGAVRRGDFNLGVKGRDLGGERVDVGRTQLVAQEQPARERLLGELQHLDGILERRAIAAKDRGIDRTGDRNHVEIERRRKPAVELEFPFAVETPGRQCREVQKPETDVLLYLVRVSSRQQDVGDVRLQDGDASALAAENSRRAQGCYEPRLIADKFS